MGAPVIADDTKWLLYWIVYTLFSFPEYFLYDFFRKFGLYWLAKFIFLIWFMMPGPTGGTNLLYYRIIRRLLIHFHVCYTIEIHQIQIVWFGVCLLDIELI